MTRNEIQCNRKTSKTELSDICDRKQKNRYFEIKNNTSVEKQSIIIKSSSLSKHKPTHIKIYWLVLHGTKENYCADMS